MPICPAAARNGLDNAYLDSSVKSSFTLRRHGDQTAVVSSAPQWSAVCSGPRWKSRAGMPIVRTALLATHSAACPRAGPTGVPSMCSAVLQG